MKKLILGAVLMVLPVLMFGQESMEQSLARGARDREEAKKIQRMIDEYLSQMKSDARRIIQQELDLQRLTLQEEMRLERNRLLREMETERFNRMLIEEFLIYRPRYWRQPYYFFIEGHPLPFEWRRRR
jgi:hypothetical protein